MYSRRYKNKTKKYRKKTRINIKKKLLINARKLFGSINSI